MVDEQSDNDGQSDQQGKMMYRWVDGVRQSDGQIMEMAVGLTDGHVNDKLMGWQMDWSYDGWMGMTDRLIMSWTDSATDSWVD